MLFFIGAPPFEKVAFDFIKIHFHALVEAAPILGLGQDFKSRLQEAVQSAIKQVPQYSVVEESGPDHDKTFHVAMSVGHIEAHGVGKSKKMAEQDAARKGLELFEAREE